MLPPALQPFPPRVVRQRTTADQLLVAGPIGVVAVAALGLLPGAVGGDTRQQHLFALALPPRSHGVWCYALLDASPQRACCAPSQGEP